MNLDQVSILHLILYCLLSLYQSLLPLHTACKTLVNPSNGKVTDSSRLPGTIAIYGCSSSLFNLVGEETQECLDNGLWSGQPPTCECMFIQNTNTCTIYMFL